MHSRIKAVVVAILTAFAGATAQANETITTEGASTVQPIVEQAAKAFKVKHAGVNFVVGGGSKLGTGHLHEQGDQLEAIGRQ